MKNAVVIVTGAAHGIGASCAELLASKGARVVLNYATSAGDAEATAERCRAQGGDAIAVQADVSSDADCRSLAKAALDTWGQIDGLINNAGITAFALHNDLEALTAADFQRIYGVNVIGAYQMIRAVAPSMQQHGRGSVVNVSSIAGAMGIGSSVAYAASKGALNTMTLSLARALAPAIRVNAVCPGFVETEWLKTGLGDNYERVKANWEATAPLHSTVLPEDVAEAAVWFLNGAAKVTGEVILLDSGFHLGGTPLRAR